MQFLSTKMSQAYAFLSECFAGAMKRKYEAIQNYDKACSHAILTKVNPIYLLKAVKEVAFIFREINMKYRPTICILSSA